MRNRYSQWSVEYERVNRVYVGRLRSVELNLCAVDQDLESDRVTVPAVMVAG